TAMEMGHVPIHGQGGSMAAFSGLTGPKKVYVHINNTNPILREDSPERREAANAGWQIGEDGMEFVI
ncbi:MAG TPA: pyrroloquinoline quinone biosynthesis protein B, partial [Verrucomicrobiae bacterium]|nr:pyrroloquinoline quinone biosynthesis protein B [Verrucomicrobiae bacterium]